MPQTAAGFTVYEFPNGVTDQCRYRVVDTYSGTIIGYFSTYRAAAKHDNGSVFIEIEEGRKSSGNTFTHPHLG